jgi:MarR family transcriptional regulator, multiple antibiotic resistance protein MarR
MATAAARRPPKDGGGQFFDDLVRAETRLYNALDDELRSAHGMSAGQYEFLRAIAGTDDLRVADLAARFALGVGTVSKAVDRMEALGWVERRPNPQNRRSSLLSLTDLGGALFSAAAKTFDAHLAALLAPLTQAQQQAVSGALALLRADLESKQLGTPAG